MVDKCVCINIPQTVSVRKYDVDVVELNTYLREMKGKQNLTCGQIAKLLELPKTQVEHYFRIDRCAAIPEPSVWPELSKLLGIENSDLDKRIMTFEEKDGIFESAERCYWSGGLAPTITTSGDDIRIIVEFRGKEK